jgi:hypothetical protein
MHALVLNGQIVRTHDFGEATPPALAANKGTWRAIVDGTEPSYDPATETLETALEVVNGVPTRVYSVVAKPAPRWSFLEFMERFTQAEQEAIAGAAMVNVQVKLWYDKAVGAKEIIADEPRTVSGMAALVAAGLLTAERRDEILAG